MPVAAFYAASTTTASIIYPTNPSVAEPSELSIVASVVGISIGITLTGVITGMLIIFWLNHRDARAPPAAGGEGPLVAETNNLTQ